MLGSKLAEISLGKGYETYSCYSSHRVSTGHAIELDITDKELVLNTITMVHPDIILHASAITDVDLCERDKDLAFRVNILGTKNVVDAAKNLGAYIVYVSTDYVFSGDKGQYREDDETNPVNYYGQSKLEGEKIVSLSGLNHIIARTSVIYGTKPATGKVNFALWILEKLKKKEKISVLVDQFVSPTLNTNLANIILEAAEKNLTGIYHVAGATRISRYNFALKLAETFNLDSDLIKQATMNEMSWIAKRPKDSSLNVDKARLSFINKPLEIEGAATKFKFEVENLA